MEGAVPLAAVDGRDIAVSGVVVVPTGAAAKGSRPVVTWAHGTRAWATSARRRSRADVAATLPFVKQLVDAGYVVAATDYEGLGTPGVHPYLVGESEGRTCSTSRAPRSTIEQLRCERPVLVGGHSQGGQSALFAGELAKSYAPELDVLGVAAAAPAADVEHILPLAGSISGGAGYLAMGIQGFHAAYPEADPAAVLSPDAQAKSEAATTQCSDEVMDAFQGVSGPAVLAHDPLGIPEIQQLLHANSAGNRPAGAPVLIVQGSADTTIPKVLTDAFDTKACAAGNTVDYRVYDGATHGSIITAAQDDVVQWLQDRVRGQARADDVLMSAKHDPRAHGLVAVVEELVLLDRVGGLVVLDRIRRLVLLDRIGRFRLLRVLGRFVGELRLGPVEPVVALGALAPEPPRPPHRARSEPASLEANSSLLPTQVRDGSGQSSRWRWRPPSVRRMTALPSSRRWQAVAGDLGPPAGVEAARRP